MPADSKDLLATVETGISKLAQEMSGGKSGNFLRYLEFASQFHSYSLHNQWLIWMQKRDATRVSGYRTWLKLGRQVRKGEKALSILAPRTFTANKTKTNDDGEEVTKSRLALRFVAVPVFDISQTDGADIPTWVSDAPDGEGDADLLAKLTKAAQGWGYTVSYKQSLGDGVNSGETMGYATSENEIALREGVSQRRSFLTLIHEVAHLLCGHLDLGKRHTFTKQDRELQAEAVAYVVAHHFGIHHQDAADYLLSYRVNQEQLTSNLTAVNKVVKQIVTALEGSAEMQTQVAA